MRDIGAHVEVVAGTPPLADTGSVVNGTSVDLTTKQSPHSGVLVAMAGAATGSPSAQTLNVKLQDSADDSTFADIVPAVAITEIAADNGKQVVDVDLRNLRRYVRAVTTVVLTGGSTPTWPVATALVMGGQEEIPIAG
jgi:hypothetical protein